MMASKVVTSKPDDAVTAAVPPEPAPPASVLPIPSCAPSSSTESSGLAFSDLLDLDLPYRGLKRILKCLRDLHPRYPVRLPTRADFPVPGCSPDVPLSLPPRKPIAKRHRPVQVPPPPLSPTRRLFVDDEFSPVVPVDDPHETPSSSLPPVSPVIVPTPPVENPRIVEQSTKTTTTRAENPLRDRTNA